MTEPIKSGDHAIITELDCAQSWLKKIEPPAPPPVSTTTRDEITA